MQIKKHEVIKVILAAAKEEFLEFGFERSSLRGIAVRAGVTKGNIYTYFKNKDDLFCTIVDPAMDIMRDYMSQEVTEDYIRNYTKGSTISESNSVAVFREFSAALFNYRDELRLLFFFSNGSSYTDFRERIYEMYTQSSYKFFGKWNELHPERNLRISEMLIHSFGSMYLSYIEEILIHDPDDDELDRYITQLAKFVHAGTSKVMTSE